MPFADFPDFASCLVHMKTKEGYSDEVARKVCGKMQEEHKAKTGMMADKKPYGDVEYADPGYQSDGVHRYPIDTEAHVRAAWSYINMPKNQAPYTSAQVASIKAKIESAAKKFGIKISAKMSAMLAFPQNGVTFTDCPKTGDTIFHNVVLMAEGTWTDSLNRVPLTYSAAELTKMKFEKTTFKAQHDIYGEQPITNEIGVIENATLSLNPAQWKGDVRIYPTQVGKDIATLIKRKQITDVSPEFFFEDIINNSNPTGITFMGAATVRKGACRVCTFNEGIDTEVLKNMTEGTPPINGGTAANGGVTAELSPEQKQRIAALEQEIKDKQNASSAAFLADVESIKKENAILKEQVAMLSKQLADTDYQKRVAELEHQMKAISSQPVIHTTVSPASYGHRVIAELDTGDWEAKTIHDFGSD